MRRLALLLLVALLSASSGGILDLVMPEQCSVAEAGASAPDGTCAATCVRCHCARAYVGVTALQIAGAVQEHAGWVPVPTLHPQAPPHDILHVPRRTRL